MRVSFALCFWLLLPNTVWSAPAEVQSTIPHAERKGQANYNLLGLPLYSAELWTDKNKPFSFEEPFALTLTYQRSIKASLLSWASISEIARIENRSKASFDLLGRKLTDCFSDVNDGDKITGIAQSASAVSFFYNGKKRCDLSYPRLRERFFGIWLGPKTRDVQAAQKLKGNTK